MTSFWCVTRTKRTFFCSIPCWGSSESIIDEFRGNRQQAHLVIRREDEDVFLGAENQVRTMMSFWSNRIKRTFFCLVVVRFKGIRRNNAIVFDTEGNSRWMNQPRLSIAKSYGLWRESFRLGRLGCKRWKPQKKRKKKSKTRFCDKTKHETSNYPISPCRPCSGLVCHSCLLGIYSLKKETRSQGSDQEDVFHEKIYVSHIQCIFYCHDHFCRSGLRWREDSNW